MQQKIFLIDTKAVSVIETEENAGQQKTSLKEMD